MSEPLIMVTMASFGLVGLRIFTFAGLRGGQGWREVRRLELAGSARHERRSPAGELIEMADLKHRARTLETTPSCPDLSVAAPNSSPAFAGEGDHAKHGGGAAATPHFLDPT